MFHTWGGNVSEKIIDMIVAIGAVFFFALTILGAFVVTRDVLGIFGAFMRIG